MQVYPELPPQEESGEYLIAEDALPPDEELLLLLVDEELLLLLVDEHPFGSFGLSPAIRQVALFEAISAAAGATQQT